MIKNMKHPLTHLPKDIIRRSILVCVLSASMTLIFDRLAFSLQWSKDFISSGKVILGLVCFAIYFLADTFKTSLRTLVSEIQLSYEQEQELAIIRHCTDILLKVRGKVWRINPDNDSDVQTEIMSTNAMLNVAKGYLQNLWKLRVAIPRHIIEIFSGIFMLWSFISLLNSEVNHSMLLVIGLIFTSLASIVISSLRIKLQRKSNSKSKKISEEYDVALNDVLNLEPLNSSHAEYMTNKVKFCSQENFKITRTIRNGFNISDIADTLARAIAMLFIMFVKIYEVGINGVDLNFVASVVALSTIYAQILNRLHSIIRVFEKIKLVYDKVQTYSADFNAIIEAWDVEQKHTSHYSVPAYVTAMKLPRFTVSYRTQGHETPFSLKNEVPLVFNPGDVVLLTGPTGCGKTTLLRLATQNIRFNGVEIDFDCNYDGYIGSLLYQADCRLGSSNVFSELTFDKNVDTNKLIYILKGLHLYEEIIPKSEDVLGYLRQSHITDFSTGQRQRLAIARLLLNVDNSSHVIGFDEATNALNDAITEQVLSFICTYCKNSIILLASHQVSIAQSFANYHLEFIPDDDGVFYKINTVR